MKKSMKNIKLFQAFIVLILISSSICRDTDKTSNSMQEKDIQVEQLLTSIRGKRVAILTNPSCIDTNKNLVYDIIFENQQTFNYTLQFAFAPEHGIRGDQDAGNTIADYVDPQTNITVYSLYGTRKAPTPWMLDQLDVVVHCILDIGTRFFTYDWTMSYALEAVGTYNFNQTHNISGLFQLQPSFLQRKLQSKQDNGNMGIEFIVLDRPNVLGGETIEGCPLEIEAGYVGRLFQQNFTIPTRYAMTVGELSLLFNDVYIPHKVHKLKVIQIQNYTRQSGFPNASLWVPPSPNMRTFDTAFVYPGTCIFEQTNISEGRGTDKPFQTIGAPFINSTLISNILSNDSRINQHARFDPITFMPTTSKFANQTCEGIEITILDKKKYESVLTGTTILQVILGEYPQNTTLSASGANKIFGIPTFYDEIINPQTKVEDILDSCTDNLNKFNQIRSNYLIYGN